MRKRFAAIAALSVLLAAVHSVAGAAPPTCFGERATESGGGGDEVIEGTSGDDVIIAGGGDDVVRGLGGDDLICGEGGVDIISGGAGNDRLSGGGGVGEDDVITFKDAARGVEVDLGAGTVTGEGSDTIKDFEVVVGSPHNDVITGDAAAEYEELRGKAGDDILKAHASITMMFGDQGADKLTGGPGEDDFFPGLGDDIVNGRGGDGGGLDVLMYAFSPRAVTVNGRTGRVTGEGSDRIVGLDVIFGSHLDDTMLGSDGRDVFNGDEGNDLMRGRGGRDRLLGDLNNDRIYGGSGDDHLDGQWQRDLLNGGPGTDACRNGEDVSACE